MLMAGWLGDLILEAIYGLLLVLDGLIYNLVRWFYEIFLELAEANIFTNADYNAIVRKVYLVLGVFMLFVLAYSLLKAVINPDEFTKGETSFSKVISNVIISLILIALMPTVFTVAFNVQHAILDSNFIGKFVLSGEVDSNSLEDGGTTIAANTLSAFVYDNRDNNEDSSTLKTVEKEVRNGKSFTRYKSVAEDIVDDKVSYYWLISHAAGVYLLYCILIFCFDLAVRVIKLAFYQIISPITIICRIMPGGKGKTIFSTWVKSTLSTYAEVFIRVAVMYLGVYMIILVNDKMESGALFAVDSRLDAVQKMFYFVFIILGVVLFIKKAPALLSEVFGLESGKLNMGLSGLKDRLSESGAFGMGAAVGGGVTSMVRNVRNTKGGFFKKAKSAVGGLGSGAARGLKRGWSAKGFGDMKDATSGAIKAATDAKKKRDLYRANHGGTSKGVLAGHLEDAWRNVKQWSGSEMSLAALKEKENNLNYVNSAIKEIEDNSRSLIEGDAAKNKSLTYGIKDSFSSTDAALQTKINNLGIAIDKYDTSVLRQLQQAEETAKANNGNYTAKGTTVSLAEIQNMMAEYKDSFSKKVANQGLLDSTSINGLGRQDREALKDIIISGAKLRGAIQDNMTSDFVQKSGITPSFIDNNTSIDITSKTVSDLKNEIKRTSTDVGIEIAQKRNQEKQSGKDA